MKATKKFIVALDGPAGSGKSSICKKVTEEIPWTYLNTGILYRLTAYLLDKDNIDPNDPKKLGQFAQEVFLKIFWNAKEGTLYYDNTNIMQTLLNEEVGQLASKFSAFPEVRKILLPLQRELTFKQKEHVIIVDGRDIATIVFPDAQLKVFITSTLEKRALRRLLQLQQKTDEKSLKKMMNKIKERDQQDQSREFAPLKKHHHAIEIDTSEQSLEESASLFLKLIKNKRQQC